MRDGKLGNRWQYQDIARRAGDFAGVALQGALLCGDAFQDRSGGAECGDDACAEAPGAVGVSAERL